MFNNHNTEKVLVLDSYTKNGYCSEGVEHAEGEHIYILGTLYTAPPFAAAAASIPFHPV